MIEAPLKTVGLDYPFAGEQIARGPYSFRITAPSDSREVRVSLDDGPWLACRKDDGHWWFDWTAEGAGTHLAVARVIEADGSTIVTQPRLFQVRA